MVGAKPNLCGLLVTMRVGLMALCAQSKVGMPSTLHANFSKINFFYQSFRSAQER